MNHSLKKISICSALIAGLISPNLAIAAEVPALTDTPSQNTQSAAVRTEPMKVVKVKASKKTSVKKATAKKAKKTTKKVAKKRVRRSIIRK